MYFIRLTILSIALIGLAAGCSSSSDNAVNIEPTVPNYSTVTQAILPTMEDANAATVITNTKATYSSNEMWTNVFQQTAEKLFSRDPSQGVDSVFFLVDRVQATINMLSQMGGFEISNSECPTLGTGETGWSSTSVPLTAGESLSIPFFNTSPYNNYQCLVTITEMPESSGGNIVDSMSYAFGLDSDSSGSYYVRYLAMSMSRFASETQDAEKDVIILEYDQTNNNLRMDYALYVDGTGSEQMGFRSIYDGDPDTHAFTYRSIMRSQPSQCGVTEADDEAKKIAASGVSQGTDSRFAMKMQRKCDQESSGYSTDPQLFCIDVATKSPLDDGSLCDAYADPLEEIALFQASDAPFSNDAFANDNLITSRANSWITVGDGYINSDDTEMASFWIDENTDYSLTVDGTTTIFPGVDIIYVAYLTTGDTVYVARYAPVDAGGTWAWETTNPFSGQTVNSVNITIVPQEFVTDSGETNSVPYVAAGVNSPIPGVYVKKLVGGEWVDAAQELPSTGSHVRNALIQQTDGQIYTSWVLANATKDIYVKWLPKGGNAWVLVGGGSPGTADNYVYDMDAYNAPEWGSPERDQSILIAHYTQGEGVVLTEGNCLSSTSECSDYFDHYTFEQIQSTDSVVQSLSIDMPDNTWGWLVAFTLETGGGFSTEHWLNTTFVHDGLWTVMERTNLVAHNVENVIGSFQGGLTATAYTDIDNNEFPGRLAIQQYSYRTQEWSDPITIDVSGSKVDDFHLFSGVPYLLYKDPSENRLLLRRYSAM